MSANELINLWGNEVRIPNVLIGPNLNLVQVRGFASLDFLADISGADVFDMVDNPDGTQRELKKPHAKEAYQYAVGSVDADPDEDPRAFTEVILNARNSDAVSFEVSGQKINFEEIDLSEEISIVADLIINLEQLTYPAEEYNPDISRVDGNHRLSAIEKISQRDPERIFPVTSFALFVNLTKQQELKVFSDINGNQQKMDTSHLVNILANQKGDTILLSSKSRAKWFAKRLSVVDGPFEGLVFMGGSKKGLKKANGVVPPLTLTGLTSMLVHTLRGLEEVIAKDFSTEKCGKAAAGDKEASAYILSRAEALNLLISRFWNAVKEVFPEAWNDKKKSTYVLYDSTGSVALSQLAGSMINLAITEKKIEQSDFVATLLGMRAEGITLTKSSFPSGLAGLAGTKVIYEALVEAKNSGDSGLSGVLGQLIEEPKSKLDG
ncbi:MAG: DGQHR domain-containing protein [Actinobacteria bacterium]|nr:DGQHR domain-containing protein [Actinomycetota bacterium]